MKMNELTPQVSTQMSLTKIMLNKRVSSKNIRRAHLSDSL